MHVVRRLLVTMVALGVVGVLAACEPTPPPPPAGLAVTAVDAPNGLQPGQRIRVKVSGGRQGQNVYLFQCATGQAKLVHVGHETQQYVAMP